MSERIPAHTGGKARAESVVRRLIGSAHAVDGKSNANMPAEAIALARIAQVQFERSGHVK